MMLDSKMVPKSWPYLASILIATFIIISDAGFAQSSPPSPNGVITLSPPCIFKAEGAWSLGTRAGDFIFLSGMPGIDPAHPPRTLIEVQRLFDDMAVEIDGVFYAPTKT
jgi:enamine deaminase RidA (YjgF/YER057c/UK114 family)